jgi:protein MpaA
VAAVAGSAHSPAASSPVAARNISLETTPSHASEVTVAPSAAVAAPRPAPGDIPAGKCATITKGAVAYHYDDITGHETTGREITGHGTPNEYLRLGTSVQGRTIWAEHWGARTGAQLLVIGQVHGNECSPALVLDELRRNPPRTYGMWIIPTLNPDGLAAHSRRNANRVDLNRDGFRRQARETRLLLEFTAKIRPTLSIHLHSPNGWVGYHNGAYAIDVCRAIAQRSGWDCRGAGKARDTGDAFLWQGQAEALPGHQSVLIELPRISPRETPGTPAKWVTDATVTRIRQYATQIRAALDATVTR